jgi:hypothetical protein
VGLERIWKAIKLRWPVGLPAAPLIALDAAF